MKKTAIIFLQIVTVLIGIAALAFMLWEPQIEGRNVHATLFQIYFNDPFLACAYIASISFFVGLYQAFKLLGYIGKNKTSSLDSIKALRTIKYCALIIISFVLAGEAYLFIIRPGDDIAGGVFMGLLIFVASAVIAIAAWVFERILKKLLF